MSNFNEHSLLMAKKIMDKHNGISRTTEVDSINNKMLSETSNSQNIESYYNNDMNINDTPSIDQIQTQLPVMNPQIQDNEITKSKIKNSKLPDNIKKLMLENPIVNSTHGVNLSESTINKASRLIKQENKTHTNPTTTYPQQNLKELIREVLVEVLTENGIITENTKTTKEKISFRVGNHQFDGIVTKVKKFN